MGLIKKYKGIIVFDVMIAFALIVWFISIIGLYQNMMYTTYKKALWQLQGTMAACAYIEQCRILHIPLVSTEYDTLFIAVYNDVILHNKYKEELVFKKIIVTPLQQQQYPILNNYRLEFFCAEKKY